MESVLRLLQFDFTCGWEGIWGFTRCRVRRCCSKILLLARMTDEGGLLEVQGPLCGLFYRKESHSYCTMEMAVATALLRLDTPVRWAVKYHKAQGVKSILLQKPKEQTAEQLRDGL